MILSDSKILINDSKNLLEEIEYLYLHDINFGQDSPLLRVRIKQFLENINSALDYAAFSVFTEYCAVRVKKERPTKFNNIERNVYFPCKVKKDGNGSFNKYIDERFPFLVEEKPEIVDIFAMYQPFPSKSKWLLYLKELVNSNKHRTLLKQKSQHTTSINRLTTSNGSSISGITVVNSEDSLPFHFVNGDGSEEEMTNFNVEIKVEFMFPNIDQPVLPTLNRIIRSAPSIIENLEKL